MMGVVRSLGALLGLGITVQIACSTPAALAGSEDNTVLQIYGLALDETRLGNGFCEKRELGEPVRRGCGMSKQALPEIVAIDVQTTPAPYVRLALAPDSGGRARDVRIWYAPREEGGQSFMIAATTYRELGLESARDEVLETFGLPTIQFSHADMEARGIHVSDLTVDTLIYVDRALPGAQWARIAHRLRTDFRATGAELFSVTNTRLRTLARLLGPDFRGAIVQISVSGWTHQSTVSTILLDLSRARSVFRLDG
ncbi:hypothetical protein [Dongia deserti]|uniref:hypothetical protein n=1 Tax=Dongia deserti TaxID=2268030 RepID=UPI0013C4306D|nr:hypothetical protein [Dongia deserti]